MEPELTVTCINQISGLYRSGRKVPNLLNTLQNHCISNRKYCPKGDCYIQLPVYSNFVLKSKVKGHLTNKHNLSPADSILALHAGLHVVSRARSLPGGKCPVDRATSVCTPQQKSCMPITRFSLVI